MGNANLKEWLARMHLITIGNCNVQEETREKIAPDVIQMEGTSLGSTCDCRDFFGMDTVLLFPEM